MKKEGNTMKYFVSFFVFYFFIQTTYCFADEITLERKVGKKYQKVTIKDVIVVEETPNCVRYLIFNKEFGSPEPRLANKTEGGDEQCAVVKKSSEEEKRKILEAWRKQASNANITLSDGTMEKVNCIAIKYPLSSTLKNQPQLQWHKPALLLRNGDEIKFNNIRSITFDLRSAIASVVFIDGKSQNFQYVIKRRLQNGDLPGVVTGVTDKFTYFRVSLDKIVKIEFIR